jgi:hypothetical protein
MKITAELERNLISDVNVGGLPALPSGVLKKD